MPTIEANGIEIYFERTGQGPRLLFISGTGQDLRVKPNFTDAPTWRAFDVLAYDQRGLGRTEKPDRPYSMAEYADDAAALMEAIGWEKALVLGASFGGMVAQELAIRHPERVERLVLACTSPGGAGGSSFPFHAIGHLTGEARVRHLMAVLDTRQDEAWVAAHPEMVAAMIAAAADPYAGEPGRAMGARRQLEARALHDAWDRLDQIRAPTMIAAGRYDGVARPEAQEAMAARIPGAALRWFEGGHLFMRQDPAAAPAMAAFLRGD